MKKIIKLVLLIAGLIITSIIIDLICIYTINKPLFEIQTDNNDSVIKVYKGIFYDTHYCQEYSTPQIKRKGTKFSCAVGITNIGKVTKIVDKTKNKINFACAETLEQFYEDEEYFYYYNCIKSKYVIVKYESGYEETVENALKHGTITIKDLDSYNIDYIKYNKE